MMLFNSKKGDSNQFVNLGVTFLVGMMVVFLVLYLGGVMVQQLGNTASKSATVTNETFDPGSDASGNAWVNLVYSDIVNGSEVVQNNLAGNNSYVLNHPNDYVLDSVSGRINVTNGSAYANTNLNITYSRTVTSNATSKSARALNNVSDLGRNIGTMVALGLILAALGFLIVNYLMRQK